MDPIANLYEETMNGTASMGGTGVVLGAALLVALMVILPRGRRGLVRLPLSLFASYIALLVVLSFLPAEWRVHGYVSLLALLLLLLSLGRSFFLLIADGFVARKQGRPVPKIFRDLAQTVIYIVAILTALSAVGVEPTSLLTTSALLTAVVGLSLQETLGNLFAGLSLQAQRPFSVGDWVQIDNDESTAGRVTELNWRSTKLLTSDELEVTVPNGVLAKALIRNYSRPSDAVRRTTTVTCPYDVPPGRVREVLTRALDDIPHDLTEPAPVIITHELADSGVKYWLRFYAQDFAHRFDAESVVRERVWYALRRAGIIIPYPTRTSYLHSVDDAFRTREADLQASLRMQTLQQVDLFEELPEPELLELARRAESSWYGPGEDVIREGDAGDTLYVVKEGEVSVLVGSGTGREREVVRLGPGQFFGEMSLMTGAERSATVRALVTTHLVPVRKADFASFLEARPELAEHISELLARRQQELESQADGPSSGASIPVGDAKHDLLFKIRRFFSLR